MKDMKKTEVEGEHKWINSKCRRILEQRCMIARDRTEQHFGKTKKPSNIIRKDKRSPEDM